MYLSRSSNIIIAFIRILQFGLLVYFAYQVAFFTLSHSAPTVLAILTITVAMVFCFKKPPLSISIFAIAFLIPVFVNEETMGRFINLGNIAFIGVLFFVVLPIFTKNKKLNSTPIDKWVFALILLYFVAMLRSHLKYGFTIDNWLHYYFKPIQLLLIYFFIVNSFSEKRDPKVFFPLLLIVASILGIIMIKEHQNLISEQLLYTEARTGGIAGSPTAMALFFLLMVPVNLSLFHKSKDPVKKAFFAVIFVSLIISITYSYARAEYIGFVLVIFSYYMIRKQKLQIIPVILIVVFVIALIPSNFLNRFQSIGTLESGEFRSGTGGRIRSELLEAGLNLLYDKPLYILAGGGLGTFEMEAYKYSNKQILQKERDPHNLIMGTLLDTGIVGLSIYFMLFLKLINIARGLLKSKDSDAAQAGNIFLAVTYGYFFCSLFQNYSLFGTGPHQVIMWSFIGVLLFYHIKEKEKIPNQRKVL